MLQVIQEGGISVSYAVTSNVGTWRKAVKRQATHSAFHRVKVLRRALLPLLVRELVLAKDSALV